MTNPKTPDMSRITFAKPTTRFRFPSPSTSSNLAAQKKIKWTSRTNIERAYFPDMDIKAGLPCQIGVSDSVISGNFSLTSWISNCDLKLFILSFIISPSAELPKRARHYHESIHSGLHFWFPLNLCNLSRLPPVGIRCKSDD